VTVAELVDRERARLARATTARGTALAAAGIALVFASAVALLGDSRWLDLPPLVPFIVWVLAIAAGIAGIALTVAWLRRGATRVAVARTIEHERDLRAGALQGALEVEHSGALGRRGAADLVARLKGSALAPATQRRAGRRALAGGFAALLAIAGCVVLAGWSPDGVSAVLHPVRAWRGTLLPRLVIDAPADVLRGERTTVRVTAPGRHRVAVYSRSRGAEWSARWYPVSDGAARLAVGPMDADIALVAADGRATSDTVLVRVSDRPFLGGIALRAIYPAYLKRADEALPAGEVARVPVGRRIMINGRASTELANVALVRAADTTRLSVAGHRFEGSLRAALGGSGRYEWRAQGAEGAIADLPSALELEVVPDSAPKIDIVSPARDTIVAPGDKIQLALSATDDHGLASVAVRSWRAATNGNSWSNSPVINETIALPTPAQWSGEATIDLSQRGLGQGDALHVVAIATDDSPWHQTGMSRELILRVPSIGEERNLARATADSAASAASSVAQAERSLEQRTEDASRTRGQRPGSPQVSARQQQQPNPATSNGASGSQSLSYASAEQAKALAQEQRQLADRVKSLEQQSKQLEQQLKQAGALDSGLANQLHQAQQLLRDALTPELKAQLDKLDHSAQQLQSGDERQTLGDLAREQQKLREQLERTVEVLKRAALEGAMQTLHDEAKDLAHRDSALGQQPSRGQQSANANEAKDLAQRSRDLSHAVDSLSKRLQREKAETGAQGVSQAQPHVDASAQDMERAANSPQQTASASTPPQQRQAASPQAGGQPQQHPGGQPQQQPGGQPQQQPGGQPQQQPGAQQGAPQQGGQQQTPGGAPQPGQQSPQQSAQQGAQEMGQAAQQLADARNAQVGEWKNQVTSELDQSIQETLQMARQEDALAKQAQQGADAASLKSQQSAIQQGIDQANGRLGKAGRQSALISGTSQRAVGEARQKVSQATGELQQGSSPSTPGGQTGASQQAAGSMRDAADALNQAAAALVRDRERANSASSSSGLAEMLQQMQQLAQQQGQLNAQSQGLSIMPGSNGQPSAEAQALAERQRRVAQSLDALGGGDASGRADALAKEAREIAAALQRNGPDPSTISRQQRLYHRLLDAGHTLENDERDSTGKRQAQTAVDRPGFVPGSAPVDGKSASKFREPTWNELRGLTAEERQLVIDYFKRINAQP
jgi:uncharacterized protein DUF4175